MAQQLYMSLRDSAQKLNSYQELKNILSQSFNPKEREVAYRCEFRRRYRQKGEYDSDFGFALRRLACLAFPSISHKGRTLYVIDQFIQGLASMEIRKHVQFNHPHTLEAAVSLTLEFEAPMKPLTSWG